MGTWIAPIARGTGVVEWLVRACESVARDAGASTVALWVMEDNPRGQRAYIRLGYDFTGAREHVRDGRDELLDDQDPAVVGTARLSGFGPVRIRFISAEGCGLRSHRAGRGCLAPCTRQRSVHWSGTRTQANVRLLDLDALTDAGGLAGRSRGIAL